MKPYQSKNRHYFTVNFKTNDGNDVYFFNTYSSIAPAKEINFDLNDADAIPLENLDNDGLVLSIVGKLKLPKAIVHQPFFRNGKNHVERMQEGLISDGTRTMQITFWWDFVDMSSKKMN